MRKFLLNQAIPLSLTVVVFAAMWALVHGEVLILNQFITDPLERIKLPILWTDVLVGFTIYIKTSIDFAIFIGHLMRTHPGWKNRIAIECGTAFGNALGTCIILAIWSFFKEIDWLLAIMVLIASLVLLKLAESGLEHAHDEERRYPPIFQSCVHWLDYTLFCINKFFEPVLSRIVPHASLNVTRQHGWFGLMGLSMSIPFILGLDDFAGYVPLFSIVHVYGFAVGVLAGHMILNICLFLSPDSTIRLVKQPIISFLGSVAFVGLALWGLYEVVHILGHAYFGLWQ